MRSVHYLIALLLIGGSSVPRPISHEHNYRGIKPGTSTREDTVRILGRYSEIEETINRRSCRFEQVIINIRGRDRVHINTITIDRDPKYRSPSGLKVGDPVSALSEAFPSGEVDTNVLFDDTRGIFYWTDGQRIEKIVLAAATKKHD
jgi:hypothetical protein